MTDRSDEDVSVIPALCELLLNVQKACLNSECHAWHTS